MKKKIEIKGIAAIKHNELTEFMHCADVFEPFKVIAPLIDLCYVIEFEQDDDVPIEKLRNYFDLGLKIVKDEFGDRLMFGHIRNVKHGDIQIENTSVVPIVDHDISVISDGEHFGLLVDCVHSFCKGVKIEEGEIRRIKTITWPQQEQTSIGG